jgi:hypothetical protein
MAPTSSRGELSLPQTGVGAEQEALRRVAQSRVEQSQGTSHRSALRRARAIALGGRARAGTCHRCDPPWDGIGAIAGCLPLVLPLCARRAAPRHRARARSSRAREAPRCLRAALLARTSRAAPCVAAPHRSSARSMHLASRRAPLPRRGSAFVPGAEEGLLRAALSLSRQSARELSGGSARPRGGEAAWLPHHRRGKHAVAERSRKPARARFDLQVGPRRASVRQVGRD